MPAHYGLRGIAARHVHTSRRLLALPSRAGTKFPRQSVLHSATWRGPTAAHRCASSSTTTARAAVTIDASALNAEPSTAAPSSALVTDVRGILQCYAQLSKARLSMLVVMSGSAGFLLAGAPIALDTLAAVTLGTAMHACAANTFNQLYEIRTDALMLRTKMRPLPSGRITSAHALAFGVANTIGGAAVLGLLCNPLTAALGTANVFLYSSVYTPMKQRSIWNTWVGAVVGGIPPLMGYAAATGTIFSAEAGILSAALFLWQFPHFFSLAWLSRKDYTAGGHKMVPCTDLSGAATAGLLTRYSLALSALPPLSYSLGITSAMFPLEAVLFNGYLLYGAYKFKETPSTGNARRVFRTSLWYLPVFMFALIFHKNEWTDPDGRGPLALAYTSSSSSSSSSSSTRPSPTAMQLATGPLRDLSNADVAAAARADGTSRVTLEGALRCAKEQMRQLCVHEVMAPPLTRRASGGEARSEARDMTGRGAPESAVAMCPVSQATHLVAATRRSD